MKSNYQYDDRAAVASALQQLRIYNKMTFKPLSNETLDSPMVEAYFLCDFDTKQEADIEKIVGAAVIKNVCSKKCILFKKKVAQNQSKAAIESLRAAKLAYKYETDSISAREYNKRCKDNYVVKTVTNLKKQKKRFIRRAAVATITTLAAIAGASIPTIALGTGIFVYNCLPDRTRQKIRDGIKKAAKVTKETIGTGLKKLYEGGKVVAEKIKVIYEKDKQIVKKSWNKVKSWFGW